MGPSLLNSLIFLLPLCLSVFGNLKANSDFCIFFFSTVLMPCFSLNCLLSVQ